MSVITMNVQHMRQLRAIFQRSVEAVRPAQLLSATNNYSLTPQRSRDGGPLTIQLQGKVVDIEGKRCHIVGFGKAVLGMAVQLERALNERLHDGVLSIPCGTIEQFSPIEEMQLQANSRIQVIEGAPDNQPDVVAMSAAQQIHRIAASMTADDILFVLISGGGSALLPLPRPPLTLDEKMQLIRRLANLGATIEEMNTVRIALSECKGGRLAAAARNAHAVVSFIISDIVGDPVDLIASGPTTATQSKRFTPQSVLEKYDLWASQPDHIRHLIEKPSPREETQPGANNSIYVVGDNRVATAEAVQAALECGLNPFIASTSVRGEVSELATRYCLFLVDIAEFRAGRINEAYLKQRYPFDVRTFQHFLRALEICAKLKKPLLLILAGEPTVKVTGTGRGGRNQELALRMSLAAYECEALADVVFLSAGTDGFDGPTPAAGAVGGKFVIEEYLEQAGNTLDGVRQYLANNDSYNFYKSFKHGEHHVVTGHTGTNVMDLQFILMP